MDYLNPNLATHPIPLWIWDEGLDAVRSIHLERKFDLERDTFHTQLWIAVTGTVRIELDGVLCSILEESPEHVAKMARVEGFPDILSAGNHRIDMWVTCHHPMPVDPVGIHLHRRRVGVFGYLAGDDWWLATDEQWKSNSNPAVMVCRYGEEPYGDLEETPDWFVAGGYGDIVASPISRLKVLGAGRLSATNSDGCIRIHGTGLERLPIENVERKERFLFYHLRKQDEWGRLRREQANMDLRQTPNALIELEQEENVRIRFRNCGDVPLYVLFNGAESIAELESYEQVITEITCVEPNETKSTLPQGMKYLKLYFFGADSAPACEFSVELVFEKVGVWLEKKACFSSDLPMVNKIFDVAVHTSEICHQTGLWDGIKRDRLNWAYDLYIASKTDYVLWRRHDVLKRSIRELGEGTPHGYWINNLPAYTLWWLMNVSEYYLATGDSSFVYDLQNAIQRHVDFVLEHVDKSTGILAYDGFGLIEWVPMSSEESLRCMHLLMRWTHQLLERLSAELPDLQVSLDWPLADVREAELLNDNEALITPLLGILSGRISQHSAKNWLKQVQLKDPITPLSAYWLAECFASYGMLDESWNVMETVWGHMVHRGATTFWESVTLSDKENDDFHSHLTTYQAYRGYRISLCHSWSSTPAPWILGRILGLQVDADGSTWRVTPYRPTGMSWCEGAVQTRHGLLRVACDWSAGESKTTLLECPPNVQVKFESVLPSQP